MIPHTKVCLLVIAACSSSLAFAKDMAVNSDVSFHDPSVIAPNIKSECTELGNNLFKSTKQNLEESGWTVLPGESKGDSTPGNAIKLEIVNALSGGNAFVGHHKSVSILATLYKDGHAIDSYTTTRSSQGGLLAGFKGSCSVLYRCVDTLGSDISRWVNSKQ